MLLDDKQKVVGLFIENLLAGTVKADFLKLLDQSGVSDSEATTISNMVSDIKKWYNLHKSGKTEELVLLTASLFDLFIRGRMLGLITGVIKEVPELEKQLEECRQHNVILAQDVKDKARIIATYEAGMYQKK